MTKRSIVLIVILLITLAIGTVAFYWAESTGAINIFADETASSLTCTQPVCTNDTWTDNCPDGCTGCIAVCDKIGTKNEGWYSKGNCKDKNKLIAKAKCSASTTAKLTPKVISDSQINLSWTAPATYQGKKLDTKKGPYVLELTSGICLEGLPCYNPKQTITLYRGNSTSFEHKNELILKPGITYFYRLSVYYLDIKTPITADAKITMPEKTAACTMSNHCPLLGQYCDFPKGTCGDGGAVGKCQPMLTGVYCTQEYKPVCGCDNNTYSNDCMRKLAGVSLKLDGACPLDDINKCVTLGGAGPNPSLGPNDPNKDKVCCAGLVAKTPITAAIEQIISSDASTVSPILNPNNKCIYTVGAGTVCIACGDGKCDSKYENKCNCPEDCK